MIIATYKQCVNYIDEYYKEYTSVYYKEYTSVYEDKSKLLEEIKHWEKEGNPMIISGIWEL